MSQSIPDAGGVNHNLLDAPDYLIDGMSVEEARASLNMPGDVMCAVLYSGLLGYWDNDRVSRKGFQHFRDYGTQWRPELPPRSIGDGYFRVLDESFPAGTVTDVQMSNENSPFRADEDNGWLAQFYLRPNPSFFRMSQRVAQSAVSASSLLIG